MSHQLFNDSLQVKCSPTEKVVLLLLAHHHNSSTDRCDPSIVLLAEESCISARSVTRAIASLTAKGLISVDRRQGRRNSFVLTPDNASPLAHSPRPLTECRPGQTVTPDTVSPPPLTHSPKPLTECHPNNKNSNTTVRDIDSASSEKLSRQQRTARELQAAQQVELGMLASAELKNAWREWQEFRTSLFLEPLTGESISPWTEIAAKRAATDLERMAQKYGDAETVSQVQLAIANRWKAVYAPKEPQTGTVAAPPPTGANARYIGVKAPWE